MLTFNLGNTIRRGFHHFMFNNDWCAYCGSFSEFDCIKTGLPGISAKQCKRCGVGAQANFLEDPDDMVPIFDEAKIIPDNYCSVCKDFTSFDKTDDGVVCDRCKTLFIPNNCHHDPIMSNPDNPSLIEEIPSILNNDTK